MRKCLALLCVIVAFLLTAQESFPESLKTLSSSAGVKGVKHRPREIRPISVGVWKAPPYVIVHDETHIEGMCVDIWKAVADDLHIRYKFVVYERIRDLLDAFKNGSIDATVGPLAISSQRAQVMMFTQPYFDCSMGIMTRAVQPSLWDRMRPFLATTLWSSIGFMILLLTLVGTLLWLVERGSNSSHFPKKWSEGIGNGMWVAISVFSTVGFGDVVPVTRAGRIICSIWMLVAMATASSITAVLAMVLTSLVSFERLSPLTDNGLSQLNGKRCAVIKGTFDTDIISHWGGISVEMDTLPKAVAELQGKRVDVVILNRPALLYYLNEHPDNNLVVTAASMNTVSLAFAFEMNSPLLVKLFNAKLLRLRENGRVDRIIDYYLHTANGGQGADAGKSGAY